MAISLEFGFVEGNNGYIVVSANGGINQQRVAVSSVSGRICCFYEYFYYHHHIHGHTSKLVVPFKNK